MLLIGCDFHTRFQQIAMVDSTTGEMMERRLEHPEQARRFYSALPSVARVGMEATGQAQWFERVLREGGHELWVGDAAEIRASVVRKQKTDVRDALHILDLLVEALDHALDMLKTFASVCWTLRVRIVWHVLVGHPNINFLPAILDLRGDLHDSLSGGILPEVTFLKGVPQHFEDRGFNNIAPRNGIITGQRFPSFHNEVAVRRTVSGRLLLHHC